MKITVIFGVRDCGRKGFRSCPGPLKLTTARRINLVKHGFVLKATKRDNLEAKAHFQTEKQEYMQEVGYAYEKWNRTSE